MKLSELKPGEEFLMPQFKGTVYANHFRFTGWNKANTKIRVMIKRGKFEPYPLLNPELEVEKI